MAEPQERTMKLSASLCRIQFELRVKLADATRCGSVERGSEAAERGKGGVGFNRYLCWEIVWIGGNVGLQFQIDG